METMLKAENVWFRYSEDGDWALKGINVEIKKGEFVAILGSNGCGKSTLAKHFNAILTPDKGDVTVLGMNTKEEDRLFDIRQKVGMVFQNPDNQIVATVVEEDVAFALENLGVPMDEIRKRIDDAMKTVGIYEFRHKAPHNLSGGQKQRVAIAGIIAMMPKVLVLDEPCAGLDPEGRELILSQVKNYHQQTGGTVILVSHSMEDIANYADKVVVLNSGHVYKYADTEEVFADAKNLDEMGLGIPDITKVFLKLKEMGCDIPTDVYTIPYGVKTLMKYKKEKEAKKNA